MAYETLLVERDGPVAVITINRPKSLNALNATVMKELIAAFDELEKDSAVRAVIVSSTPARPSDIAQARPKPLLAAQTKAFRPRIRKSNIVSSGVANVPAKVYHDRSATARTNNYRIFGYREGCHGHSRMACAH